MKHMRKCPRTPSHEVCRCRHTPLEPPHARQGINKETYPPPNKPPPRAPRRRPTTHVRILCSLHSRPFARRKKAWYEGHPYVTKRREPHATGGRTSATKHTYHKHPGAQEEQEVCPRTYMPPQTTKGMDVHNTGHADGDTCNANAPSNQRNRHPFSFPENSTPHRPPLPKKIWTPPKNTRRTRGHQQRGTEKGWYEGIPSGQPTRTEVIV